MVRGKSVARGEAGRASCVLFYKPNLPPVDGVVEAKDSSDRAPVASGMGRALGGERDHPGRPPSPSARTVTASRNTTAPGPAARCERELPMNSFASRRPVGALLRRQGPDLPSKKPSPPRTTTMMARQTPRYYQLIAINRTVEAIARGENRMSAGDGHGHRQNLHRVSNHLAAVEIGNQETHPLPRRPQHPRRSDQDQRLQAVRPGDDQDHPPHGRQVLRNLLLPLPGRHRHRGRAEHLQAVLARLLRPRLSSTSATGAAPPTMPPG